MAVDAILTVRSIIELTHGAFAEQLTIRQTQPFLVGPSCTAKSDTENFCPETTTESLDEGLRVLAVREPSTHLRLRARIIGV